MVFKKNISSCITSENIFFHILKKIWSDELIWNHFKFLENPRSMTIRKLRVYLNKRKLFGNLPSFWNLCSLYDGYPLLCNSLKIRKNTNSIYGRLIGKFWIKKLRVQRKWPKNPKECNNFPTTVIEYEGEKNLCISAQNIPPFNEEVNKWSYSTEQGALGPQRDYGAGAITSHPF